MKLRFAKGIDGLTAIDNAITAIVERYDGNIKLKRCDHTGSNKQGGENWTVTLTVHSSKERGASITMKTFSSRGKGYTFKAAACWHGYGYFMNALPAGTLIISRPPYLNNNVYPVTVGIDNIWQDFQVGPDRCPIMASDSCNCNEQFWDWNTQK